MSCTEAALAAWLDELEAGGEASLSDEQLARLLGLAVRRYAERAAQGGAAAPFTPASPPSSTEVAIAVSAMLEQVGIEVFELGLWRAWGPETQARRCR